MKIIKRIKAWLEAPVEVYDPSKPRSVLHVGYLVTQICRDRGQVVSVVDHGRNEPNG